MASFIKTIDEAMKTLVFDKFKSYLGLTDETTGMSFVPKSIAQRKTAEKRGKDSVEFMSLWRDPPVFDWKRQRTPLARRGMLMEYTNAGVTDIITVKAVPTTLNYEAYFWTKDLDKLMQISEAYVFWIHSSPELSIYYDNSYLMEIDFDLKTMVDESPLDEVYKKGTYFVYKAPISLQAWIITSTTTKTILEITMKVYYTEQTSVTDATAVNSKLVSTTTIITSDES